jgi:hypothetical protein
MLNPLQVCYHHDETFMAYAMLRYQKTISYIRYLQQKKIKLQNQAIVT